MKPSRTASVLVALQALLLTTVSSSVATAATKETCKTISVSDTAKLTPAETESRRSAGGRKISYKVSVSLKVCFTFDGVTRTVNGRSTKQIALSKVSTTTKVSHSGHLPVTSGSGGNPDLDAVVRQHMAPINYYGDFASVNMEHTTMRWENGKFRVTVPDGGSGSGYDTGWHNFQTAHFLYRELVSAGFSCDATRCKPNKSTITGTTVTHTKGSGVANGGDALMTNEEGVRIGLRIWVGALTSIRYVEYFWDVGGLCPSTAGCNVKVRSANSITSYSEKRLGAIVMPSPRFFGVPAENVTFS